MFLFLPSFKKKSLSLDSSSSESPSLHSHPGFRAAHFLPMYCLGSRLGLIPEETWQWPPEPNEYASSHRRNSPVFATANSHSLELLLCFLCWNILNPFSRALLHTPSKCWQFPFISVFNLADLSHSYGLSSHLHSGLFAFISSPDISLPVCDTLPSRYLFKCNKSKLSLLLIACLFWGGGG